ncbi:hypothetical protein HHI36_007023 [Cryptolaemus montrouzieri]|uniref:IGFBP N-terminal domain-containing protein n=1 Tax=Cryptolaemus montrouzieri TaxID=559131 RepID=A0ABD2MNF6_9CUCU
MNSKILCVWLLLSLELFFHPVSSLTCLSNACELEESIKGCKPPPEKCPDGYDLKPGGHCLCCKLCKKILYEGGNCTSESLIGGVTSDKVVCADNLICLNNVCQ